MVIIIAYGNKTTSQAVTPRLIYEVLPPGLSVWVSMLVNCKDFLRKTVFPMGWAPVEPLEIGFQVMLAT